MSSHEKEDQRLLCKIKVIHAEKRQRYGSPRIHAELKSQGEHCGQKRVARLMQANGIEASITASLNLQPLHNICLRLRQIC